MEQRNYEALLPKTLAADVVSWVRAQAPRLEQERIIYKATWMKHPLTSISQRVCHIKCTGCGSEMLVDKVENDCCHGGGAFGFLHPETGEVVGNGDTCSCPACGERVKVSHSNGMNSFCNVHEYPVTVHAVEGTLALCRWCVCKWFMADGSSGISVKPYEAIVVEKRKLIRLSGWDSGSFGNRIMVGKWKQRKRFTDVFGRVEMMVPWDGTLLEGTTAENSKLDLYMAGATIKRPSTYLKLWRKHPNIENLVMQGAGFFVGELVDIGACRSYGYSYSDFVGAVELSDVNWKACRPSEMLGLRKNDFRRLVAERWTEQVWRLFRCGVKLGLYFTAEDLRFCDWLGVTQAERLVDEGKNPVRVARYLQRQQAIDKRCDYNILKDYWAMAAEVGYNLDLSGVLYPQRLYRAHDAVQRTATQIRTAKKKRARIDLDSMILERGQSLSVFAWAQDGILITPAGSLAELEQEGTALHHCVSRYAQDVAIGKTAIFFIRKATAPTVPWFTLELDEHTWTVVQNRGSHNCAPEQAVVEFQKRWIEHLRRNKTKPLSLKQEVQSA